MLNTAARLLDRLGCTPTSRAALGLDLTRARGEALRLHLAERYADEEGVGEAVHVEDDLHVEEARRRP